MSSENQELKNLRARTGEFIIQFYLVIVGVAVGYSVDSFSNNLSLSVGVRFLTLITMLLIWLHGQLGVGTSEYYEENKNWFTRSLENYIEAFGPIALIFGALNLQREIYFFSTVAVAYGFDLILNIFTFTRLNNLGLRHVRDVGLSRIWIIVDTIATVCTAFIIYARLKFPGFSEMLASVLVLSIITVVTFLDYYINRDFYFNISPDS